MSELRGYDAWKTTPPDDGMEECPECDGTGAFHDDEQGNLLGEDDEGNLMHRECERCEGTGWVERPTREEIKEEREEREFDRLHEEGRI